MSKSTYRKGKQAEELAAAYLESKGWTVLDRNYRFQRAEVDIVARDENCIIFVEVKSRSGTAYGRPEDFIDEEKIKNLYKAAGAWIYERKMEGAPARFDVLSIIQKGSHPPEIEHFEDAIR